jgi:hypothetical protein
VPDSSNLYSIANAVEQYTPIADTQPARRLFADQGNDRVPGIIRIGGKGMKPVQNAITVNLRKTLKLLLRPTIEDNLERHRSFRR